MVRQMKKIGKHWNKQIKSWRLWFITWYNWGCLNQSRIVIRTGHSTFLKENPVFSTKSLDSRQSTACTSSETFSSLTSVQFTTPLGPFVGDILRRAAVLLLSDLEQEGSLNVKSSSSFIVDRRQSFPLDWFSWSVICWFVEFSSTIRGFCRTSQ